MPPAILVPKLAALHPIPRIGHAVGHLAERFGLDLADPFAGEAEGLADFFECARLVVFEAKTHPQDGRFSLVHRLEHLHHMAKAVAFDELIVGAHLPLVHHHIAQRPARLGLIGLRRGVVDLDRLLDDRQLFLWQAEDAGDLFVRGASVEFFDQSGRGTPPLGKQLDHVCRDADRLARVDQRPLDRLLDPVAGVGTEACAHCRVEAFDRSQEAEVAFFDQVLQAEALARVAAGDVDDEPQVGTHHTVASCRVALADTPGQLFFFVGVE